MADYITRFLDGVQVQTESNGQQFDEKGKPLVGRYRDGTTPKPGKEAYGAGQIQKGTAKRTAEAHGIRYDEKKLLTDRNYNLEIADLHMGDLLKKYGNDRTLARAAYHSGEPTVDRAVAKYGRDNFAQGLGPHGREYIKMGSKPTTPRGTPLNASTPGIGVGDPRAFLEGLQSSLGVEAKASQGVRQPAAAIFGSDKEFNKRADAVEATLSAQGQTIDLLSQVTEAAQGAEIKAATQQLEETRGISNEITKGTQALKQQVKPVFEARGRIADQLDRVNTMNPLERGLRGIFDLNYDRDYLEGQLDHYDRTLQARASDYDYLNKLHSVALSEAERRYKMDTTMPRLMVDQSKEDLALAGMRLQQTSSALGSLRDRISGESALIAAKAGARNDLMARLDAPTKIDLATQARQNGGVVAFNGVEFSYKELREDVERDEQQTLAMENVRQNIANGRMDLAEKNAVNLARSLTREQLESAIANGGVYNGIQLPQDALTTLYQGSVSRDRTQAEVIATTMPASMALQAGSDAVGVMTGLFNRGSGLFGNSDMESSKKYLNQGSALVHQLVQMTAEGQPPEVIAQQVAKIEANTNEYRKQVSGVVLRSVGGDKEAAGYVESYIYGTPMDPGSANRAMAYFAVRGSLPQGLQVSQEARDVFRKAQLSVEANRVGGDGKPRSREALLQAVTTDLGKINADSIGTQRFLRLYADLPQVARQIGSPMAKLDPAEWARLRNGASADAEAALALTLKTTPDNVATMARTGKPLDTDQASLTLFKAFQQASGQYNALEQRSLMTSLDDLPYALQPGTTNSRVYLDLINNPKTTQFAAHYENSVSSGSFGDYLLKPISEGATERRFAQHGSDMAAADQQRVQENQTNARGLQAGYARNPKVRTAVILNSIPGVGKAGTVALLKHLDPVFTSGPMLGNQAAGAVANAAPVNISNREVIMAQESLVFEQLRRMKFDDPALESYRKAAVGGWEANATQSAGFMQHLIDGFSSAVND